MVGGSIVHELFIVPPSPGHLPPDFMLTTCAMFALRVPNTDLNVTFSITGPGRVLGTTNGDPACHLRGGSSRLPTFHGLLRGIIASSAAEARGNIVVRVEAEGVEAGQVTLQAM